MILNLLKKIFGTKNDRELKRIYSIVNRINELEQWAQSLKDEDFKTQISELKEQVAKGRTLDEILPSTFALVREASVRTLNMRHFDVQLIGGVVLHEGKIAEMKTGEGKTLTATLALTLNALAQQGAHLVTVNDYLAKRDSEWMGQIYSFLGLSTGLIIHGLSDSERKEAYACDITYGTNNEFGFDYLRDNMKTDLSRFVQRGHFFAIVDEVDSILIDEARTPLIISGPSEVNTEIYYKVNAVIPGLHKDSDYIVDEKSRTVTLTEDGISKVEKRLRIDNLYDPSHIEVLHHVEQALKAHVIFKKDVDYVVKEGQVIIVDEFTGRLMPGRRYSDGLHGALEAKEHLPVQSETQTLATITFQNFFRMYNKLAGMTGTADTEAVEFKKIYNLDVVVIPTNKKMIRIDHEDIIYRTSKEKFNMIAEEIEKRQKRGQPVLVGTISVEKSELLSILLKRKGIPHEVLNAKNHAREAAIIAQAGHAGHVTISTNMAGRGTDIVLGEGVVEKGGLCVIGTERHESRRIDNQLRGRSGRQGDPGESIFYLSLEDDLMRTFAADKLSNIMHKLGMKENEAIVSPMITRVIEKAQKRVEEYNFSIRKHLLEYDDVMNQQRQIIYRRRYQILNGKRSVDFLKDVVFDLALQIIDSLSPEVLNTSNWDLTLISKKLKDKFNINFNNELPQDYEMTSENLAEFFVDQVIANYEAKKAIIGEENMTKIENYIYLQIIDSVWKDHLLSMDHLKDSVSLRGYGQRDPLQEYKKEAFRLFSDSILRIEEETTLALIRMPVPDVIAAPQVQSSNIDERMLQYNNPQQQANLGSRFGSRVDNKGNLQSHQSVTSNVQPFQREFAKVGRNDPCPCGSGKKYKKCHGQPGMTLPLNVQQKMSDQKSSKKA